MDNEPDPDEAARWLRAAVAYVGMSQDRVAKAIGVSVPTLARMMGRKGADGVRPATWGELWRAADALGLPRAWFVFDPGRLQNIVPDDMPSFPNDVGQRFVRPTEAERTAAAAREEQALQREAQRSRERQQGGPRTKRGPRRRRHEAD